MALKCVLIEKILKIFKLRPFDIFSAFETHFAARTSVWVWHAWSKVCATSQQRQLSKCACHHPQWNFKQMAPWRMELVLSVVSDLNLHLSISKILFLYYTPRKLLNFVKITTLSLRCVLFVSVSFLTLLENGLSYF